MIVTSSDDVVRLSGALVKNQWLTIKAAANLLLQSHPQGIIIDCGELTHVSEDGAKTFLDAIRDIQAAGARIVVCNLPAEVLLVIRTVPGVRSQLPIANSVEEARASLRLSGEAPKTEVGAPGDGGIVIPLLPGLDVDYALTISSRLARDLKVPLHIVYLLEVARHLPLSSPLGEEEAAAQSALALGTQLARKLNLAPNAHLERVRDAEEGLLQLLKTYQAGFVVLGAFAEPVDADRFHGLVDALLRRAPCNVLIGRRATAVIPSVPGARPRPRSIRPGWSASSMPNCSATTSDEWFGSITPPEPSRIVLVPAARWAISTAGEELAMPGMLWCSATQKRS